VNRTWISGTSCPGTDRGGVREDMGGLKRVVQGASLLVKRYYPFVGG
jgi:hypothetical protein